MSEDELRLKRVAERLRPAAPLKEPDGEPVDGELVRRFVNGELDEDEKGFVGWMIGRYENWDAAFVAAMDERHGLAPGPAAVTRSLKPERYNRKWLGAFAAMAAGLLFFLLWGGGGEVIRDGGLQIAMRSDGTVSGLSRYDEAWQQEAADAIQKGVTEPAPMVQMRESSPVLRGAHRVRSPAILSPYVTIVRETQPVLRWASLESADGYRVELFREGGDEPVLQESVTETEWKVAPPLTPGETYRWRVLFIEGDETLVAPGRTEMPAVFKVMDAESRSKLEAQEAKLNGSQLLLGLLYLREGLLDEAEQCFLKLKEQNPNNPAISRLLTNLQALRDGEE